jgi:exopolysaccharide biosynthesis predicted pyruvyltransferase EpsI
MHTPVPFYDYLRDLLQEPFIYVPNPGNAGDGIIAAATYQIFDLLGLDYEMPIPTSVDVRDRVVVYGGGGNLVGPDTYSSRFLNRCHKQAKRLIVLPQTVKNVDLLLSDLGSNAEVICREPTSFDYVVRHASKAKVLLADDMALSLDIDALLASPANGNLASLYAYSDRRYRNQLNTRGLRKEIRAQFVHSIVRRAATTAAAAGNGELYAFRLDGEKTEIAIPQGNVDLSEIFSFGLESQYAAYFTAYHLLSFLRRFPAVHTNRLHIAVAGALLGMKVYFHDNSYYKCREVYRFSMKEKFPNVMWCDVSETSGQQ